MKAVAASSGRARSPAPSAVPFRQDHVRTGSLGGGTLAPFAPAIPGFALTLAPVPSGSSAADAAAGFAQQQQQLQQQPKIQLQVSAPIHLLAASTAEEALSVSGVASSSMLTAAAAAAAASASSTTTASPVHLQHHHVHHHQGMQSGGAEGQFSSPSDGVDGGFQARGGASSSSSADQASGAGAPLNAAGVVYVNSASKQKAYLKVQNKIGRIKDDIKREQGVQDGNVNEYLKLSSGADKLQAIRIKQVFEKKNQKSAQVIAQLQRKLDEYERRKKDLEDHASSDAVSFDEGGGGGGSSSSNGSGPVLSGAASTASSVPAAIAIAAGTSGASAAATLSAVGGSGVSLSSGGGGALLHGSGNLSLPSGSSSSALLMSSSSAVGLSGGGQKPGQIVRDSLKHVRDMSSSVMSKPKEFANLLIGRGTGNDGGAGSHNKQNQQQHLLQQKHKFGSADDLNVMSPADASSSGAKRKGQQRQGSSGSGGSGLGASSSVAARSGKGQTTSLPREQGLSETSYEERRKCLSEDGRHVHGRRSVNNSNKGRNGGGGDGGRLSNNPSESGASAASASDVPPKLQLHGSGSLGANNNVNNMNMKSSGSPQRQMEAAADSAAAVVEETSGGKGAEWGAVMEELALHREEVEGLRDEMDRMRLVFKAELEGVKDLLREENDKCGRLEEQLNDLTELHQHEIANIQNLVVDNEEFERYRCEEEVREIKEHLKMMETKMSSMEIQQVQQQYLHIEGLDSNDARALLMKLLTAAITVVQVLFFVAGVCVNIVRPFVSTLSRTLLSALLVVAVGCVYHQQEHLVILYHRMSRKSVAKGGES